MGSSIIQEQSSKQVWWPRGTLPRSDHSQMFHLRYQDTPDLRSNHSQMSDLDTPDLRSDHFQTPLIITVHAQLCTHETYYVNDTLINRKRSKVKRCFPQRTPLTPSTRAEVRSFPNVGLLISGPSQPKVQDPKPDPMSFRVGEGGGGGYF